MEDFAGRKKRILEHLFCCSCPEDCIASQVVYMKRISKITPITLLLLILKSTPIVKSSQNQLIANFDMCEEKRKWKKTKCPLMIDYICNLAEQKPKRSKVVKRKKDEILSKRKSDLPNRLRRVEQRKYVLFVSIDV